MMVGYRITPEGRAALDTLLRGGEFLWVPNYNYDRLEAMLLTLNKLTMTSRDDWFYVEPEIEEDRTLLAVKALERDALIRRSPIPGIERYLKIESFRKSHPGRRSILGDSSLEDF